MNFLNVVLTIFFLAFGVALFGVPYAIVVACIAALLAGLYYLIQIIKSA